jgi:hypothetical protein
VFCGPLAQYNHIDDHGSHWGDTAPILALRWQLVALSEALNMPNCVMQTASSQAATMIIQTDQINQQKYILNCINLNYYSYVGNLHNLALS